MNISIIVAIDEKNGIGKKNDLLVYISNDLKRFKRLTTGHTIVMGRKTFESLPKGALPNRKNVVLTKNKEFTAPDVTVVHSVNEVMEICNANEEIFIIGGAKVYKEFFSKANKLFITKINKTFNDADTFFPEIDYSQWNVVSKTNVTDDEQNDFTYDFIDLERKE